MVGACCVCFVVGLAALVHYALSVVFPHAVRPLPLLLLLHVLLIPLSTIAAVAVSFPPGVTACLAPPRLCVCVGYIYSIACMYILV